MRGSDGADGSAGDGEGARRIYNGSEAARCPLSQRTEPAAIPDDTSPDPIQLVLGPEVAGQRLDRALADALPAHSRTVLTAWIRDERVTVDGAVLPAKARLQGGESVEIRVPPPAPSHLVPEDIPLAILHEDEAILVIDKPPGLTVHPGAGQKSGTLANALAHHLAGLPELGGSDRPGIVHRLDKETSGVIVVARTEQAQRTLSAAFAERSVSKTYLACVHGHFEEKEGRVTAPIGRSPAARTKMTVRESGRSAETSWAIERELPRHTLVRCRPRTGRTHQIRVHMKHLHHPIVGDAAYGMRGGPGEDLAPRLLLHAWQLAFAHPVSGDQVAFEAPLPEDFRAALDALGALDEPRRKKKR